MAIETPNVINALGHFDLSLPAGNELIAAAGFTDATFNHSAVGVFTIDLDKPSGRNVLGMAFGTLATNATIDLVGSTITVNLFDAAGVAVDGSCHIQVLDVPNHT